MIPRDPLRVLLLGLAVDVVAAGALLVLWFAAALGLDHVLTAVVVLVVKSITGAVMSHIGPKGDTSPGATIRG